MRFQSLFHHGGQPNEFANFLEVAGRLGGSFVGMNSFSSITKAKTAAIAIPSYYVNTGRFVVPTAFLL
jgi:hypothetical protein